MKKHLDLNNFKIKLKINSLYSINSILQNLNKVIRFEIVIFYLIFNILYIY